MNLYIIGPVTGIENENRAEFERAQSALLDAGYIAYIPHEVIPRDDQFGMLWGYNMKYSIRHIICNYDWHNEPPHFGIAMLDGWENSKGATIEHDLAVALGIPCKPWREWL